MSKKITIIIFSLLVLLIIPIYIIFIHRDTIFDGDYKFPDSNVILISIDTLRADHLGCYGYPAKTSPNIDKFSLDSILFEENIVQAPATGPSHGSIFTSVIPSHHGAFFSLKRSLPSEFITMAEFLKEKGYHTISFNGGGQIASEFGYDQGFDIYDSTHGSERPFIDIVNLTINWIEKNPGNKFFFFLHTFEVHHPYKPDENILKRFNEYTGDLPNNISFELLDKINKDQIILTPDDVKHIISTYDAEIYSMDIAFGYLIDYLKSNSLYDNTTIIFTSDHGEEFNEHGMMGWHTHTLYDELLRVPLIIKLPNQLYAKKVIMNQTRSLDILPTLLGILDIESDKSFEGVNLFDWFNNNTSTDLLAISQMDVIPMGDNHSIESGVHTPVMEYSSIRSKKWKLYGRKLFDLEVDSSELSDISVSNKRIVKHFKANLVDVLRNNIEFRNQPVNISKETQEQLKSLGYTR